MLKSNNSLSISTLIEQHGHEKIRQARRMLVVNLIVYTVIAAIELWFGAKDHAVALTADGQNNLTGIVTVSALIVGLSFATRPSDTFHLEGHWQFENLVVFLAGLGMFLIGLITIWEGLGATLALLSGHAAAPLKGQAAIMAAISAVSMLILCWFNHLIGQHTQSSSLAASAKDFLGDALTSTGTMIAILGASYWHIHWIDPLAAVLIGLFLIWNGSRILSTSAEKLSNGFNPALRTQLVDKLQTVSGILAVSFVDGRYAGSNIIVEAEIVLPAGDSLAKSYRICKSAEQVLQSDFPVLYCCIQVKPNLPKNMSR